MRYVFVIASSGRYSVNLPSSRFFPCHFSKQKKKIKDILKYESVTVDIILQTFLKSLILFMNKMMILWNGYDYNYFFCQKRDLPRKSSSSILLRCYSFVQNIHARYLSGPGGNVVQSMVDLGDVITESHATRGPKTFFLSRGHYIQEGVPSCNNQKERKRVKQRNP